jgi:outer membrane murein-binding lipoprotein Lpp
MRTVSFLLLILSGMLSGCGRSALEPADLNSEVTNLNSEVAKLRQENERMAHEISAIKNSQQWQIATASGTGVFLLDTRTGSVFVLGTDPTDHLPAWRKVPPVSEAKLLVDGDAAFERILRDPWFQRFLRQHPEIAANGAAQTTNGQHTASAPQKK